MLSLHLNDSANIQELLDQTTLDSGAWDRLCDRLAERFRAHGALIVGEDISTRLPHMPHSESLAEHLAIYSAEGWAEHDLRSKRGFSLAYARGHVSDRDIANDIELTHDPYYAEFIIPSGVPWFGATAMRVQKRAWGLSILRSNEQGPLTPAEFEELGAYRPALALALRRAAVLGTRRIDAIERSLGGSRHGLAVIDHAGKILWHNAAAEDLFASGGVSRNGFLSSGDGVGASALRALVAGALMDPAHAPPPVQLRAHNGDCLVLDVIAMPHDFQSLLSGAAAVVTIRRTGRGGDRARHFRARFGLTAREAELADAMASGRKLGDIAGSLGMSVATSRQHLKAIFKKTGTHRQAELVAALAAT